MPYTSTSLSQAAAIVSSTGEYDPETYREGWPPNNGFVHRGVTYWSKGDDRRILYGTGNSFLIALDAMTRVPVSKFGSDGRIDLTRGLGCPGRRLSLRRHVLLRCPSTRQQSLRRESGGPPGIKTGEKLWHFQTVHHGLWNYDLPAAPNLVDITLEGRCVRAVAQVSKQAFCYSLTVSLESRSAHRRASGARLQRPGREAVTHTAVPN